MRVITSADDSKVSVSFRFLWICRVPNSDRTDGKFTTLALVPLCDDDILQRGKDGEFVGGLDQRNRAHIERTQRARIERMHTRAQSARGADRHSPRRYLTMPEKSRPPSPLST